jgi:hypothetical protein
MQVALFAQSGLFNYLGKFLPHHGFATPAIGAVMRACTAYGRAEWRATRDQFGDAVLQHRPS